MPSNNSFQEKNLCSFKRAPLELVTTPGSALTSTLKNIMCYYSETHFLRFCCLFLKHFVKISDAFQWLISREELVLFQKSTIRTLYNSGKCLNKNPQKHDFFLIIIFDFSKNFSILFLHRKIKGKIISSAIIQKCIFCVFVASFWIISWK